MIRTRDEDVCPGTLQAHSAADGGLARVRLPGGMISSAQLSALARVASSAGSGILELTSRGGVQLRGITDLCAVVDAATAANLLPSITHDRVRNIVSSPLSGRSGGFGDVRPWVGRLDDAIQNSAALASLPGRFLFGIDDGRGDVAQLEADVGVRVLDDAAAPSVALSLAGVDTGVRLTAAAAIPAMITVAKRFTQQRGKHWRIREMSDRSTLLEAFGIDRSPLHPLPTTTAPPVGWIEQEDGRIAVGAAVPFGVVHAGVAHAMAAFGAPLIVTPWRSVLLCDLDGADAVDALRTLAPRGLVFDKASPWLQISACVGNQGCRHSATDVRADATAAVEAARDAGKRQHWVGCQRACGSPPRGEVLVATGAGYRRLTPEVRD
ncbi:precorrin-3B synthase [Mycobacterium sp. AT1]|uniref:precorrin-3B synthase n=1 Tax=Mycobacterium sp. AT1 TaxID=1961706 RepID=UPI0009AD2D73|nr:precorrin-3B synthase [Mycobacterium sp. AT1]OPX09475.1 precorrin-3B synthase [Mycobacterium sp. AT1]